MTKQDIKPEDKPLTKKEAAFVDYLFICGLNGYAAAVKAGYSEKSAYNIAYENVRKPHIKKQIDARLAEVHMASDEALAILALHGRGDMGDFIDTNGNLDLELARKAGLTKLIKKIKQRTITKIGKGNTDDDTETHDVEIELHDPQSAIDKILKVQGRYIERHELTGKDGRDLFSPETMTPSEILARADALRKQIKAEK